MMKRVGILIALVVILLVLSVFGGMFYVVDETQQVIITQFGEPVGEPVTTPRAQDQNSVHPEGDLLREAVSGVGR